MMSTRRLGRAALLLVGVAATASGCAHHNVVRNAGELYGLAELDRMAGRSAEAEQRYGHVVRKTSTALVSRPDGPWAGEAFFLLGSAHYRLGQLREARGALASASNVSPDLGTAVSVFLALVDEAGGDYVRAMHRVSDALDGELSSAVRAEAHLLRGRLHLRRGAVEAGWWDLDRAEEAYGAVRVDAALIGFDGALQTGDPDRATEALARIFGYRESSRRSDEVEGRLAEARRRWGTPAVLAMTEAAGDPGWPRVETGRLRLLRARLLHAVGRRGEARTLAESVRGGLDEAATEARLLIASWDAVESRGVSDLGAIRRTLLPGADDPRVAEQLDALDQIEALVDRGLSEPIAWFAAGEIAREVVGAPYLAHGLFLAYASAGVDEPWIPKALLAAVWVSEDEEEEAWLLGRLEAYRSSPYVLAASGGGSAGVVELEEALDARLAEVIQR